MNNPVTNLSQRVPMEAPSKEENRDTPTTAGTQEFHSDSVEAFPRPFGRYELRSLLGRGGMGAVYLAHDSQLHRLIALKVPRPVGDDENVWRQRFLDEARAAATLQHPNICPVFEVGEVDSQPYLTMAYIEGESLATRLARIKTLPLREAVQLVRTMAGAMAEAHERGIIHRDLKPANVMIDRRGQPIVMDFGLALRATASDDLRLTLSGVAVGTPAYMPPEQAGGDNAAIGPPTDVYALGVILYELVTGRVPFKGTTFGKLVAQIERDPPPFPSEANPEIDPALEAILLTALEKVPDQRFATAGAFTDALDAYLQGERDTLVAKYGAAVERAAKMTQPYILGEDRTRTAISARKLPPRRRWPALVALGMMGVILLALLGGVIYVQTDYGELVVELSDASAKVEVRVNGEEVILDPKGKPIHIRPGAKQKLEVSGPDFKTTTQYFDLIRNGKTVAHVTLVPRDAGLAKNPVEKNNGAKPEIPDKPSPPPKPVPKLVEYPKTSTLIEISGWQILTDATKDDMQKWLDERKKNKHSVMWLDACEAAGKPVFVAVAALDNREPNWMAMLDEPMSDVNAIKPMRKKINTEANRIVSMSGYGGVGEPQAVILWKPGQMQWQIGYTSSSIARNHLTESAKEKSPIRVVRPFSIGDIVRVAEYMESTPPEQTPFEFGITLAEAKAFIEKQRTDGKRIHSIAAYPEDGNIQYAVLGAENKGNLEWQTDTGLSAAELKTEATSLAAKGFRPHSISAYVYSGPVRYCVVWVKEPPKATPFPKQSTLIEAGGWQILTDATKDEMQKWLDERKEAKHSVTWLDACEVAGKPVFAAVAAVDKRLPGAWHAFLDVPAIPFPAEVEKLKLDRNAIHFVALAGYVEDGKMRTAVLFHPEYRQWYVMPNVDRETLPELDTLAKKKGYDYRIFRPYPGFRGATLFAMVTEPMAEGGQRAFDLTRAQLAKFEAERRAAGHQLTSVTAYLVGGELKFAAIAGANPNKGEWQTDTGLTAAELKGKATGLAAQRFFPASVTAYPWDGAVHYCVVWVKEPPKVTPFPKQSTLIEVEGWQILTDATKDEMQKWLDERKEAKHSVTWLDACEVAGKPVFSAVAALDDRHTDWTALLDMPADSFLKEIAKHVSFKTDHPLSASGYSEGGKVISVLLWRKEFLPFYIDPDAGPAGLKIAEQDLRDANGVIRGVRPYPVGAATAIGVFGHRAIGDKAKYAFDLTEAELEKFIKEQQDGGRITSLAAYPKEGNLLYAVVGATNPDKLEWKLDRGITATELKTKAAEAAKDRFRAHSVTAYPWNGAVRYCVIWVKDRPPT